MMKTVIIESPYSGATEEEMQANIEFGWKCIRDSCSRGEAPFASHLFYTRTKDSHLADGDNKHWITREEGLKRCEAWRTVADMTVFYIDRGWSPGMILAMENACQDKMKNDSKLIAIRRLIGKLDVEDVPDEVLKIFDKYGKVTFNT
jgi:hypothetical protein